MSATAVGAAYGFRRSLLYGCGLILGTTAVLLAVAVGVVTLLLSIPHGAPVLVAVSAAYILYLAFRIATAPPLAGQRDEVAAPAFAGGFLLAVANPKAYLAIAAVFAGTSIVGETACSTRRSRLRCSAVMIVIIHMCWLLAGASLSRVLQTPSAPASSMSRWRRAWLSRPQSHCWADVIRRTCVRLTRTRSTATGTRRRSPAPPPAPPDTATSATAHRPATPARSRRRRRTPRRTAARTARCPSPG